MEKESDLEGSKKKKEDVKKLLVDYCSETTFCICNGIVVLVGSLAN